ncbi:DNA polymerase sliding clamp [Haladaptatus salinisoli]|uniref:DNA polymerase sliding clamp n=1 Tax=Haladaptatus salinisoli TaxID=2884876 RepID=UPI003F5FC6A8
MFEAVVDAEAIQTTVELVDAVVDECHVYFDDDGVRIPAMDPATVAAVDLRLESDAFEAYEASDAHVGVDVSRLGDIVGMADRDQLVRFALDAETRALEIRIGELAYTLALLDPDTVRSPPDRANFKFEFAGGITADAEDIRRTVRAADMVSDHVTFGIDEAEAAFYVEAEGDTDDVSLALPADDLVEFRPGEARSLFSIDYLKAIEGAMPRDLELDLRLGTELPLAVRYAFAGGAGSVEYLVSPRIAAN